MHQVPQSLAIASPAEYWHIGATTIRLLRVRVPIGIGENNWLIGKTLHVGHGELGATDAAALAGEESPVGRFRSMGTVPFLALQVGLAAFG